MTITLKRFCEDDFAAISAMMTRAFDADSMMHRGIACGPEGYDDGSFIRKYALHPAAESYTIFCDGEKSGLVILWIDRKSNENFLGCLFTDPALHGSGVGARVWRQVEALYPDTRIWRTETPLSSTRNLNFYINKCGFMAYRIIDPKDRDEAHVQFVKFMGKRES